ncbi:MAG: 2'-5' RNA ligase family protein, partial [Actinomycetota bacterium]
MPPPVGRMADDLRRRWDPAAAALVGAHVTIAYEVDDGVASRLRQVAAATAPVEFTLTRAACWSSPAGGIYFAVEDRGGAIGALRRSLQIDDPPDLPFTPHVTLVHPRSATSEGAAAAWSELRGLHLGRHVTVD